MHLELSSKSNLSAKQKTMTIVTKRTSGSTPKARNSFTGLLSSSSFSGRLHSAAPALETRPAVQEAHVDAPVSTEPDRRQCQKVQARSHAVQARSQTSRPSCDFEIQKHARVCVCTMHSSLLISFRSTLSCFGTSKSGD